MRTIQLEDNLKRVNQTEKKYVTISQSVSLFIIVLLLLASCIFISPIIVFSITTFIGLFLIGRNILVELTEIEYDLGNDLLDLEDIHSLWIE